MRDYHVWLVTDTFGKIADREAFVHQFYTHLFQQNPHLESLFANTDLKQLNKKIHYALTLIVTNLRNAETMNNTLRSLGRRHLRDYGVHETYFQPFGESLLYTLEQQLGPYWNDQVQEAWQVAFDYIVGILVSVDTDKEASA